MQITFFNQNCCVWPQNGFWPPKSSSSSLAKTLSRTRCAPGTAVLGPFPGASAPSAALWCPQRRWGRFPRVGRAFLGFFGGVSGCLVGLGVFGKVSGCLGGVSGQWDEHGRSQTPTHPQCRKHPGCRAPPRFGAGVPGDGAGGRVPLLCATPCHPVPPRARTVPLPSRSRGPLSDAFPSAGHLSPPKSYFCTPSRQLFKAQTPNLHPRRDPRDAPTLCAPLNLEAGGGDFFCTLPYKRGGTGTRLHIPPSYGIPEMGG